MRNLLFFLLMAAHPAAYSQETFKHTLVFSDSLGSPQADLNAVRWISGHWTGEAFGGITEEVWTPPLGGSMMCAFKLVIASKVKFYEIATITEENGTLMLRLKHFHATLTGWEEKDKTVDFRLVKIAGNKVYFDEFTFEKVGKKKMNIYVVIENKGKKEEVTFSYTKK